MKLSSAILKNRAETSISDYINVSIQNDSLTWTYLKEIKPFWPLWDNSDQKTKIINQKLSEDLTKKQLIGDILA